MSDLWKKFTNKNRFEDEEDDEITEDPEQEEAPAAPAASSFGKSTGASALELKVVRPETYGQDCRPPSEPPYRGAEPGSHQQGNRQEAH